MNTTEPDTVIDPEISEHIDVKEPKFWRVIMHNDNVTTMDFVVALLVQVFHKNPEEALQIMLGIHTNGRAIVGTYTHEVAEDKQSLAMRAAQAHGFPLQVSIEEETE